MAGVDDAETRLFSPEPAAHGEFGLAWLLLLLLPWRSNGSASAHATINVLLFLLRRFQNLQFQATDVSFVYMSRGNVRVAAHRGATVDVPETNITSSRPHSS